MLTPEQFALRKTGITSSDITRLVGESPWGGAHDVYLDKVGDELPRSAATIYQRIGHALEPLVLELIGEQFGVALAHSPTIQHPEHAWAMTTPDGVGAACTGEAKVKSISFARPHEWDDDDAPPAHVFVQAQWHCEVKRVPRCYVGALLGAKSKFYVVEHDVGLGADLLEIGYRFHVDHVLARVPPPADGSPGAARMLKAIYAKSHGGMMRATPQVEQLAADYFAAQARLKDAEAAKELAAQRIKESLGSVEGVVGAGWRATLKERAAVTVAAHTKAPYRHFDIRQVKA